MKTVATSTSTICFSFRVQMMSVPILLVCLLSLEIKALIVSAAVLTLQNSCPYTVWPAATFSSGDANPNSSVLGFSDIPSNSRASLSAPPGWSGRIWARTGCLSTSSRAAACTTGDSPPFTLAEFTLSTQHDDDDTDSYDVNLVQGYNVGIGINASSEGCKYAGCFGDMNAKCPAELRVEGGADGETVACKTPCQVFGAEEYCCTGKHSKRETCGQTRYTQLFKSACPNAYAYVYDDDATSAFTCAAGADYLVTFCPAVAAV